MINPRTVSSTASHQHQQEQELLSGYTVPNPPVSTQQSTVIAAEQDPNNEGDYKKPRTLWMGDLDPWLDESGIQDLWWNILQKKVNVKIIKPKNAKLDPGFHGLTNSGYCFVEFESFEDAQQALSLNGQLLPDIAMPSQQNFPNNPDNQKKYFRLNWASGATLSAPIVQTPEYSLFVGDLSASTTEAHLLTFFQKTFPNSIKTVRVMTDPISGKSRCFGFVRFTEESERQRALVEMNGVWFAGRPLRVALATPRSSGRRFHNNGGGGGGMNQSPFLQQQSAPPLLHQPSGEYFGADPNSAPTPGSNPPGAEMMFMSQPPPPPPPGSGPMYGYYGQNTQSRPLPPQGQDLEGLNLEMGSSPNPMFQSDHQQIQHHQQQQQQQQFSDPNNTTVFVGGLSSEVTEPTLYTLFKPFGTIQQVKIPPGKNCGFVKYSSREEAEEAIAAMQGFIIGGNRVRLSWGRVSMTNKKYQQQQHQVAQAAQLQVAAALSMGMDPASAIAAAAAAAAGGYAPNMPPPGHQQIPPNGPPPSGLNIPPPPIPGLGVPLLPHVSQYQNIPHQNQYSSDDGSGSVDNSAYDFENSPLRNRNFQPSFFGDPGLNQESLINAMGNMSLENEGYGYMIPSGYGGYGVTDIPHYNQLLPEGEPQEEEEEDQEEEGEEEGEGEGDDGHEDDKEEQTEEVSPKEEVDEKETT